MIRRSRTPKGVPSPLSLALWLMVSALLATAPAAYGHGALESSSPAAGSQLTHAPEEIVLEFGEPISAQGTSVALVEDDDTERPTGDIVVDDVVATVPLRDDLPDGRYELRWSVRFLDGAESAGTVRFSVGTPDGRLGLLETVLTARHVAYIQAAAYVLVGGLVLAMGIGMVTVYARPAGRVR